MINKIYYLEAASQNPVGCQMTAMTTPIHTYSIVAFDPATGRVGAAMQTHNFEACNGVIWVQPGVGAVASQAGSDPFYAFAGFEMMRLGKTAEQTLTSLVECDAESQHNQVAIIDTSGNVAAFTGEACIPEAGHLTGQITRVKLI